MEPTSSGQDILQRLAQRLPGWSPDQTELCSLYDQQGRLIHLSLAGLHLDALPPEVWHFSHLRTLHLGGNHLKQLPAEIGQLVDLSILTVSNNHLEQLPAELRHLTQLRILKVRGNSLHQFPAVISQLPMLRELDLAYNQLRHIPAELGQFSHLRKLYLAGNQIGEFPAELGQLSQLQVLDLRNNHLEQRPRIFDHLPPIQELWQDDEQEDWFAPYRDDDPEEEVDPYLPYIATLYSRFYSNDRVMVANQKGMLAVRMSGMGYTGSGFPDIVVMTEQSRFLWETRGGEEALDPGDVREGMHQAQLHVHALNTQPKVYVGGWNVGDITHPEIQRNDLLMFALTRLCEGPCILDFANGGQITIGVAAPGVLGYTWRKGTPRLNAEDIPALVSIRPVSDL